MVPGVVGSSPITHPRQRRGSGLSRSPLSFHIGASPSGKARDFDSLIRWFESSRPSQIIRAGQRRFIKDHDPVAQSAEQLPFKQWVRGSNPRRVTTSEQAAYRLLRLFFKKSERTHSAAPPFQPRIASLGSRLVLDADLKAGASKVFTLSTSEQSPLCSDVLLFPWNKRTSSARSLAPPFQIEPAALGFDLGWKTKISGLKPSDTWSQSPLCDHVLL